MYIIILIYTNCIVIIGSVFVRFHQMAATCPSINVKPDSINMVFPYLFDMWKRNAILSFKRNQCRGRTNYTNFLICILNYFLIFLLLSKEK